ncbi:MAG: hypothetical protein K0Q50_932 [Vampirovibrio sp.]|jgi:hypothetical protein|nr:hypothetical protein [Vampirovibrio sp.]
MSQKSGITLQAVIEHYLKSLEEAGKSPRTLYTYGKDCQQILAYFGTDKKLTNILPAHVAKFYKSDELLKIPKNGKDRAAKTVNKTKLVFRCMLTWAMEQSYIEGLPLPKAK